MNRIELVEKIATAHNVSKAEAARIGGGKSFGRQSGNVTQRQATPPANQATPGAPAQNANPAARPGTPAAAA